MGKSTETENNYYYGMNENKILLNFKNDRSWGRATVFGITTQFLLTINCSF